MAFNEMLYSSENSDRNSMKLKEIQSIMKECNCVKYAAYRTALKLRVVQKSLYMDKVSLKVISNVFERHHLQQNENSTKLRPIELESILSDISFVVEREADVEERTFRELITAFLLNIYDTQLTNSVDVLSCKIFLTLLCEANLKEKYLYLFNELADHNNCLSKRRLQILLKRLISVVGHFGEKASFGPELIAGTVESCWNRNSGTIGISESCFISWTMQDPQLLMWLSTFYRIQVSESVTHNAKCDICKIYPMVGLRYRCLRCLGLNMCQTCFFTKNFNAKHKAKHPIQEYCYPVTAHQSTKAFILTLKNLVYRKNSKLQYLPAIKVDSYALENLDSDEISFDGLAYHSKTLVKGSGPTRKSYFRELQDIILLLEKESKSWRLEVENVCMNLKNVDEKMQQSNMVNCLMKHKVQVESLIHRLNVLKRHLVSSQRINNKTLFASTPVVHELIKKPSFNKFDDLRNLSPISLDTFNTKCESVTDTKFMWDNYDLAFTSVNCETEQSSWQEIKYGIATPLTVNTLKRTKEEGRNKVEKSLSSNGFLKGRQLNESEHYSRRGFTWLQESDDSKNTLLEKDSKEEEENRKTLDNLHFELKGILNKLNDLSACVPLKEEQSVEQGHRYTESIRIEVVENLDFLLVDLIKGIEKLTKTGEDCAI